MPLFSGKYTCAGSRAVENVQRFRARPGFVVKDALRHGGKIDEAQHAGEEQHRA